jgi:hypothetical protein
MAFFNNPTSSLDKALMAVAAIDLRIDQLQRDRAAALAADDEDIASIEKLDAAITEQQRSRGVWGEKIAALQERARAERRTQMERQRETVIKVIAKKLDGRRKAAAELEATIVRLGDLFFELLETDNIAPDWPFPEPWSRFGVVDRDVVCKEVGWALYSAGRPKQGNTVLPGPFSPTGVIGLGPRVLAAAVSGQCDAVLEALRIMPLDDDEVVTCDLPAATEQPPRGVAVLAMS